MTRSTFRGLCVCLATVSLAGCQDYDGGFSETKIKEAEYTKNFENAFGKIDPTQDWNLATRGTVTVAADPGSEIKIYAKVDGTYKIVGDYENFSGNGTLNFDMLEGTTDLLVTNGMSSAFAKVGESVSLSGTRTTYPGGTAGISVATEYTDLDAEKYVGAVVATNGVLPENGANLGKVTQNFTYISNGSFTIHPVYWNTSSKHILGIYWKNGDSYNHQDIYKDKEGNELAQKVINETQCQHNFNPPTIGSSCGWHNHTVQRVDYDINGDWTAYDNNGEEITGQHQFEVVYHVGDICPTCGKAISRLGDYGDKYVGVVNYNTSFWGNNSPESGTIGSKAITVNLPIGTQFGFYLKVFDNNNNYNHTVYSSGELNELKKGDFFDTTNFPTNSSCVVKTAGHNTEGTNAFAATFQHDVDGNAVQYLCFEDWSVNVTDLNDLVFAIPVSGGTPPPTVVDEEASEWVICGEDLGGSFDLDYNDVVVSISYVAGTTKAKLTALAAGGTLASYVYFNEALIGEIHELLGADNAVSGDYEPLNVGGSVGRTSQHELTVASDFSIATVEEGTMVANMGGFKIKVVPQGRASTAGNAVGEQKVQEYWVTTSDKAPYVFCVPRFWEDGNTKRYFRWPKELQPVYDLNGKNRAYAPSTENFSNWVSDKTKKSWYKHPVEGLTIGF